MDKSDLNQLKSEVSLLLECLEERQGQIEPLDQTQIRNLGWAVMNRCSSALSRTS
jgi:hypothetical protein